MMRAFIVVAAAVLALAVPLMADHDHQAAKAGEKGCCDPARKMDCCAADKKMDCCDGQKSGNEVEAKLSEMDAKLQQLVNQMNALQGAARVDAMAAVLTELAAQRTIMRTMMASQAGMHDCCGGGSCDMMHGKESAAHH